jgi:hypothetical protein
MVLANRLNDGRVVFLATNGQWVEDIAGGAWVPAGDAADRLLAAALADEQRNIVVEPYLVKVRDNAGTRIPVDWREAIRAAGPTVRTDLD